MGSVALVTGASSGIGKSCAELLCRGGYRVYGASRRGTENSMPGFVPVRADVTSDESVREAVLHCAREMSLPASPGLFAELPRGQALSQARVRPASAGC